METLPSLWVAIWERTLKAEAELWPFFVSSSAVSSGLAASVSFAAAVVGDMDSASVWELVRSTFSLDLQPENERHAAAVKSRK